MKLLRRIVSTLVVCCALVLSLPGLATFANASEDKNINQVSEISDVRLVDGKWVREIDTPEGRQVLHAWRNGNYLYAAFDNSPTYRAHIYNDYVGYGYITQGGAVYVAQIYLAFTRDFSGSIDGRFGPITSQAVYNFQRRNGLSADSIVGPNTWIALWNIIDSLGSSN